MSFSRRLGALLLALAIPAAPETIVHGIVEILEGAQRRPVADAAVRAYVRDDAVAVALSGRDGRYTLEVPAESFELRLVKQGYVVERAGGLALSRLQRSCPAAGDCGAVDFLLQRAAAVEIWLSDPSGDPFPGARLALTPEGEEGASRTGETDDRGAERLYGLAPGRYRLDVRIPAVHPTVGRLFEMDPLTIELRAGESSPVHLAARRAGAETFSFQGVIEGFAELERGQWLQVRNLSTGESWSARQNSAEIDLPRLARGEYVLELFDRQGTKPLLLGRFRMDENKSGLALRPRSAPALVGYVRFEDDAPDDVRLRLRSEDGWTWRRLGVNRRNPNFNFDGPPPGRYRLECDSEDGFLLEERDILLTEGSLERVELIFSARFATVRGRVRSPGAGEMRVDLNGASGVRAQSLGPANAFSFDRLRPGAYTLCAAPAGETCPEDRRRRFTVDAGDDVEIELGAPQ